MLLSKFYYLVKPVVPSYIRLEFRRWLGTRLRLKSHSVWPILPGSEKAPPGWQGWPDGKKFAFVLTHDVEGKGGLAKSRELMELEKKFGFRSSFNFIPEGDYHVSRELRDELTREGFEVGVHDLRHDGKLYSSPGKFAQQAVHINDYLKDWGAAGFRSGFMFHNLQWLQSLDIQYDSSTFDTDPFEPQPDGVGTIFPFWVQGMGIRGYVELPYTLPQDSTLFILLKEQTIDIWLQKLDWIVTHGGMALLNVHPDYIQFPGESPRRNSYPIGLYEDFLRQVSERYGNQYWNALPRQVAAWHRNTVVAAMHSSTLSQEDELVPSMAAAESGHGRPPRRRAAVVIYSYYETDSRPLRETEALASAGMDVDVICLRAKGDRDRTTINGVNIYRISLQRRRKGAATYALQYAWFTFASMTILAWRSLKRRYDLVHVHNMPDVLVFSALAPKLRGAKVVLDLHDPMPELFRSIFHVAENHFIWRSLRWMERRSIAFSDLTLTPNLAFQRIFASRSCPIEKIRIVMNSPDTEIFKATAIESKARASKPVGEFVLMYHGLLVERHGLDLVIEALVHLRPQIPGIKLELYGESTDYMTSVMQLVRERRLEDVVTYHGFKPLGEIAKAIANIDLGVIPNRLDEFTRINLPTRIFEYLAMNKPVIAPRTEGIQDYFKDDEILFFQPGQVADLATSILWAFQHPEQLHTILEKGRAIHEEHSWDTERERFVALIDDLLYPQPAKSLVPSTADTTTVAVASQNRPLQGKRAIVILYSYYPADPRPRREAEALIDAGMEVDLICLGQQESERRRENVSGINVLRVPMSRRRVGKLTYSMQYSAFTALCTVIAAHRHLRKRYDLVHVHNMPDFLAFSALIPKLFGAAVVLDLHDPMPELMMAIFGLPATSHIVRLLKYFEKQSVRFADSIMTVNSVCARIFAARGCPQEKIQVIMNSPDESIFVFQPIRQAPQWSSKKPFVLMYHGSIVQRHGLDLAIQALGHVRKIIPNAELRICGAPTSFWDTISQWPKSELEGVSYLGVKTLEQIVDEIDKCDLGIIPNRKNTFTEINTPTRIFEYLSRGKPVIAPRSHGVTSYFGPTDLLFFALGDVKELTDQIVHAYFHPEEVKEIVERGQEVYLDHKWSAEKRRFLRLIEKLAVAKTSGSSHPRPQKVVAAKAGAGSL